MPEPSASRSIRGRREPMLAQGKRIVVVLPAYNAAKTLRQTFDEIPRDVVDDIILTDDASGDETARIAHKLGIPTLRHDHNRGYGGNHKNLLRACARTRCRHRGDAASRLPVRAALVTAMASMIASDEFDAVLGSRILGRGALAGGMPVWKYISNRVLTLVQNLLIGQKLSEYHTGYRAWSRAVLEKLPLLNCSEDFVFDDQMLAQAVYFGFRIGEISCPTKYFADASSINFRRSLVYGLGVLKTSLQFRLQWMGLMRFAIFRDSGEGRLAVPEARTA